MPPSQPLEAARQAACARQQGVRCPSCRRWLPLDQLLLAVLQTLPRGRRCAARRCGRSPGFRPGVRLRGPAWQGSGRRRHAATRSARRLPSLLQRPVAHPSQQCRRHSPFSDSAPSCASAALRSAALAPSARSAVSAPAARSAPRDAPARPPFELCRPPRRPAPSRWRAARRRSSPSRCPTRSWLDRHGRPAQAIAQALEALGIGFAASRPAGRCRPSCSGLTCCFDCPGPITACTPGSAAICSLPAGEHREPVDRR